MRRLWPRSLAGQLITLLLLALVLAQAISLLIFADERRLALLAANREEVLARTATIVRLLDETPLPLHERVLDAASTGRLRFWLAPDSAVERAASVHAENRLAEQLRGLLGTAANGPVLVDVRRVRGIWGWRRDGGWHHQSEHRAEVARAADVRAGGDQLRRRPHDRRRALSLLVSVGLEDGRWLNAETLVPPPPPVWAAPWLVAMGVMAVAVCAITVLVVRRLTRPMSRLASAADALGRGEAVAALPEVGPQEVRRTTRAFNQMEERLRRFVEDRTRMLAAISHDLRTPLTSLRLRAEFVEDEETRRKILETLDEMQKMTEATLAFAREEAAGEPTRLIDLAALVESVCADLADLGRDVTFTGTERAPYACRPLGLKRAVRNLVENAVAYGLRARVAVHAGGAELRVVVDDDGPGIPDEAFERVFEPFVRLEESRSPETGGIGLGLAIARTIVRGHGGEIRLENRAGGGLRATIVLPVGAQGARPA